jgi:hypothetical protein
VRVDLAVKLLLPDADARRLFELVSRDFAWSSPFGGTCQAGCRALRDRRRW